MLDLALYLATLGSLSCNTTLVRPLSFRRLKEPNATADRYIDGRGMSFGLEDQKAPAQAPQLPAGAFLFGWLTFAAVAIKFKPSGSKWKPPKHWKNTLPNTSARSPIASLLCG